MSGQRTVDVIGRYPAASNIGWIQVMGPEADAAYEMYVGLETEASQQDAIRFPPTFAEFRYPALERLVKIGAAKYMPPLFAWRYSVTPVALAFLDGTALGPDYDGAMLVGDVRTGCVYKFALSPDRMDLSIENALAFRMNENSEQNPVGELSGHVFAENIPVATDFEQGPDGTLWIT